MAPGNATAASAAVALASASALSAALSPAPAAAGPDAEWRQELNDLKSNLDQFFIVICSMIIFFMQTGFAFIEAGSVRSKNTTNILMKNTLDMLIGGISYWIFGHAFAFSEGNKFIGYHNFFAADLEETHYAKWFYGFTFASTAATIVSGAVAERCSFVGYLTYTSLISGVVYPVVAHWAWTPGGWLTNTPFKDFGGSGVVHLTGGSAALVSCLILGPRLGLFDPVSKTKRLIRGHSTPLASLGCFILLFGFLAFNTSSLARISQKGDGYRISLAVTNTILSGAAGGLSALFFRRAGIFVNNRHERANWSFLSTVNGAFVGMVSICAGCDSYPTWASVIVGTVAAAVYLNGRRITSACRYMDDPLDAVPVHLGGSWWGLVAAGIFSREGMMRGNGQILLWNVVGGLCIMAWSCSMIGALFLILKKFNLHRVTEEEEIKGLDMAKHREPAYPIESWMDDPYCFRVLEQVAMEDPFKAETVKKDPRLNQAVGGGGCESGSVVVAVEEADLASKFRGILSPSVRAYYNVAAAAAGRRVHRHPRRPYTLPMRPSNTVTTLVEADEAGAGVVASASEVLPPKVLNTDRERGMSTTTAIVNQPAERPSEDFEPGPSSSSSTNH